MCWKSWHIIYTTTTVQPSSMDAGTQPLKRDASGLLQAITNFEFVVTFFIGYLYLSHMSALTTKLQRTSNDIFKAFTMVSSVLKSYQYMRADMDKMYDDAYEKAMAMAAKVGVAPTAPRVAGRQRHRATERSSSNSKGVLSDQRGCSIS